MPSGTLQGIQKRIDALLSQAKRLQRKRVPALRRIVNLARANSISIAEIRAAILGGGRKGRPATKKKTGRRKRKVAAMYKNPKTGETWSGRGRPARWLAAAEKEGRKRSEFLVKKS
jgi:DNA-binding protein H-NS